MTEVAGRQILARRARFIAIAVASLAAVGGGCRSKTDATPVDAEARATQPSTPGPAACSKPERDSGAPPWGEPLSDYWSDAHFPSGEVSISPVDGGALGGDLAAIMSRNRWRFRICYDKALVQDPSIAGSATVAFTISPHGEVEKAAATKSTLPAGLDGCLKAAFLGMVIPGSSSGAASFSVTLDFTPKK